MNRFGGLANRAPVGRSADWNRVVALPVRTEKAYPANLIKELSRLCSTPEGIAAGVELREVQAKGLYDLGTYKQGFFPMRVGSGKTLVTFLAPRMVGAGRPLLLTKASLIEKTDREWRKAALHWKVHKQLPMRSYEFLGRVSGAEWIDRYKPDMIIADECQYLKNRRAAVTRRVERYMKANPKTIFVPLTGTMMKRTIKDFAHLLEWSHGQSSCLPLYVQTLLEWAEALDEGVNMFQQRAPGAMLDLMPSDQTPSDEDENKTARRVFQKRLEATAGVVISDTKDDFTGSLLIEALEYTPNEVTDANFKILRETMCRPDGWALTEAMQVWAVARQLALGLHYEWDPAPPQEWLDARKQWAAFVRDTLADPASARAGLDSELQIANAVLRGDLEDEYGVLAHWQTLKPTFDINPKDVWHDDSALTACAEWIKTHPRGIVWTEHQFFARTLSRMTGVPYYGAQGLDAQGNLIDDPANPYVGPIIASIAANCTGRNLQLRWHENLITAPAADSERNEQLIARTHRPGQTEDTVTVDVLVGCREHLESIPRALASSDIKKDLLGFTQKLRIADIVWPESGAGARRSGPRWG